MKILLIRQCETPVIYLILQVIQKLGIQKLLRFIIQNASTVCQIGSIYQQWKIIHISFILFF